MKKRTIALLTALVLSSLAVMGLGAYMKYELLPYGVGQDKNIVELPFLLLTDKALRYEIEIAMRGEEPEAPVTDPSTEPTTVPTTEPSSEPTTEPTTEPATKPTTEPPTISPTDSLTNPSHEHSYVVTTIQPTCIAEGYDLHECAGCGDSYQDSWTEKLAHSYLSVVVEPTAEAEGYTEHVCTACGDSYRDAYTQYTPPQKNYTYPGYDFSPGAVSSSWYDNVLFIGDSRTVGLRDYARSGNADYFCSVGMSVFSVQSTQCSDTNFSKQTLESLLASKTYNKVLISLGINECGYATSSLISAYKDLIELIRLYQPDAKIILQSIMTVTKSYSSASYFQPDHIFSINERIKGLSDGTTVFYIDVNEYFTDSDGYLYKDITGDGCHLYASYYAVWAQWISYAVGQLGI